MNSVAQRNDDEQGDEGNVIDVKAPAMLKTQDEMTREQTDEHVRGHCARYGSWSSFYEACWGL